jgi:NTE family protein
LVAVLYGAGLSATQIEERALQLSHGDIADFSPFAGRTLVGQALQDYVNRQTGGRPLEALAPRVVVVATRRDTGERAAFDRGNAGVAVRASSAQPGNYLPVRIRGVEYVDGDLSSPVPIRLAKELGALRIVAVDVSQNVARAPAPDWAPPQWTSEALARRRLIEAEAALADVVIEPPLPYLVSFDLDYRRMAIAAGERAARAALPQLRALAGAAQD